MSTPVILQRPPQACSTPSCGLMCVPGRNYCEQCLVAGVTAGQQYKSQYDKNRPFKHLYNNARWRMLRAVVLRKNPICVLCRRAASKIADHIRDHKGNESLFWDINNLRALCKLCHDIKTGMSFGKGGKTIESIQPHVVDGKVRDYDTSPITSPAEPAVPDETDYLALMSKPRPK